MVPPTGNGVLNQIPAGDGRESSREQAVPDDGAPVLSCANAKLAWFRAPLTTHGAKKVVADYMY